MIEKAEDAVVEEITIRVWPEGAGVHEVTLVICGDGNVRERLGAQDPVELVKMDAAVAVAQLRRELSRLTERQAQVERFIASLADQVSWSPKKGKR